jgi:hypothetical protein
LCMPCPNCRLKWFATLCKIFVFFCI